MIHFIDNTAALSCLIKGCAFQSDMSHIVAAQSALCATLGCSPFYFYVRSKANIADLPSREAWAELRAALAGIPRHPLDSGTLAVPGLADWNAPLASWATRHNARIPQAVRIPA